MYKSPKWYPWPFWWSSIYLRKINAFRFKVLNAYGIKTASEAILVLNLTKLEVKTRHFFSLNAVNALIKELQ